MTRIKVAELPPVLRFTAAAKVLGISRATLYRWVDEQRICRPIKLSPRVTVFETTVLLASLKPNRKN
ncbi:MAG TPA: helix-turn-helix domain-containing protein [Hyphomicrobiaceae bacterium]|jgi:predicted DNA-binding transcriptional regulator AlpA|nr:helix-turn-helix domain-containing protein [Hyphomicrobiaceae bacterium]